MYPELFRIGNFVVSSYGVMVAIAFLVATYIGEREWHRRNLPKEDFNIIFALVIGGAIFGSKALFLLENIPFKELLKNPLSHLFSRGGFTYYGGFFGAAIFVLIYGYFAKIPLLRIGDTISPSLTIGYAIGRVGCLLVGDDYGRPTDLPWAISFPEGTPPTTVGSLKANFGIKFSESLPEHYVVAVHPTQIYEIIGMLIVFFVLWRFRRTLVKGNLFGLYLILQGIERFSVEFLRMTTPSFIPGITIAQLMSLLLIAIGGGIILWKKK